MIKRDWIEQKTEQLLTIARQSGFFGDVIRDARDFEQDGYVWDVALIMSLHYWVANPVTGEIPGLTEI